MASAVPLLTGDDVQARRTWRWRRPVALFVVAGGGLAGSAALLSSDSARHLLLHNASASLHVGMVAMVDGITISPDSAEPAWLAPLREIGRAQDGGDAMLRMFDFMPKTCAYPEEISPDAASLVRVLDEQRRSPALQKEVSEIFQTLTRRQNFTGILLLAEQQNRIVLHEHLGRVLEGLQPWLDAHRELHEDSDLGSRQQRFLSAVQGLVPFLKESLFNLHGWVVGENDPPFFKELATALHAHGQTCATDMLQHAAIVSGAIFQAGIAYCESVLLDPAGTQQQGQGQAVCDMSWSWGLLPSIREAVHAQAMQDFGLPDEMLTQCLLSEVSKCNVLAGANAGLPWLFTKHICTGGRVDAQEAVMGELSRLHGDGDIGRHTLDTKYFAVYHKDKLRVETRMNRTLGRHQVMLAPQSCGQGVMYVARTGTWQSLSGSCKVTAKCISSPNYPDNYGNNEYCSARSLEDGTLVQDSFETESGWDYLSVDGHEYCGDTGPDGRRMRAGGLITWTSDHSDTDPGWKICLESPSPPDSVPETVPETVPTFCKSKLRQSSLGDAIACAEMWLSLATPNAAYPVIAAMAGMDSAFSSDFSDFAAEGTLRHRAGDGLLVVPP